MQNPFSYKRKGWRCCEPCLTMKRNDLLYSSFWEKFPFHYQLGNDAKHLMASQETTFSFDDWKGVLSRDLIIIGDFMQRALQQSFKNIYRRRFSAMIFDRTFVPFRCVFSFFTWQAKINEKLSSCKRYSLWRAVAVKAFVCCPEGKHSFSTNLS